MFIIPFGLKPRIIISSANTTKNEDFLYANMKHISTPGSSLHHVSRINIHRRQDPALLKGSARTNRVQTWHPENIPVKLPACYCRVNMKACLISLICVTSRRWDLLFLRFFKNSCSGARAVWKRGDVFVVGTCAWYIKLNCISEVKTLNMSRRADMQPPRRMQFYEPLCVSE